jgi:hypothetical protein
MRKVEAEDEAAGLEAVGFVAGMTRYGVRCGAVNAGQSI